MKTLKIINVYTDEVYEVTEVNDYKEGEHYAFDKCGSLWNCYEDENGTIIAEAYSYYD